MLSTCLGLGLLGKRHRPDLCSSPEERETNNPTELFSSHQSGKHTQSPLWDMAESMGVTRRAQALSQTPSYPTLRQGLKRGGVAVTK